MNVNYIRMYVSRMYVYLCIHACKYVCMYVCVSIYVCIVCKYLRVPAYLYQWKVWRQEGKGGKKALIMV